MFGSTSGACSPRGDPTVKNVLSRFSEFYLDGIPATAERGIEDLYQKYAEFSRTKIVECVQSNALPVWASKNALNHMHQGSKIGAYAHTMLIFLPPSVWCLLCVQMV